MNTFQYSHLEKKNRLYLLGGSVTREDCFQNVIVVSIPVLQKVINI